MNISVISKIGTELGYVLPQDIVEKLGIKAGDQYSISLNKEGSIVLSLLNAPDSNVRPEVVKSAKQNIERYDETLRGLKER